MTVSPIVSKRPLFVWLAIPMLAVLLWFPSQAEANSFLRPATRPLVYSFGFGPAIGIVNRLTTDFQFSNTFGYHLSGGAEGLAVGMDLDFSFSSGVFDMQLAPRVWWDFRLLKNLGIYLSPFFRMGYNLSVLLNTVSNFLGIQVGLRAKVMMAGRFYAYLQPIAFDMFVGGGFALRVSIALGGGITF